LIFNSGLGVGIAAESFITRGINTTVVEIDPVVYRFAREYFNLPKPQHVYLQDARTWVQEHSTMAEDDKFDYVIHDCFSGGGVPQHIYTVEFWDSLKSILKEDGVLAVVCYIVQLLQPAILIPVSIELCRKSGHRTHSGHIPDSPTYLRGMQSVPRPLGFRVRPKL